MEELGWHHKPGRLADLADSAGIVIEFGRTSWNAKRLPLLFEILRWRIEYKIHLFEWNVLLAATTAQ
jgi:hypothetical protein